MARGKKKESALMPEKKLAQAFVPAWEQPYKVPGNWHWVTLGNLIELISGRDAALSACNDQRRGIPYILGASNIENNTFYVERWIVNPEVVSRKGDILLSVKGTIGKLYIQREDEINISRQIMSIRPRDVLSTKLVYFYLQLICEELREAGNGLIPGISRKDILERSFPLAPKGEQQRIVDRIEYLFAKLDEAKEKVQSVLDSFEARKASILHKAFTGELTGKWRAEYGVGMGSWNSVKFSDVLDVRDGTHDSPQYYDAGYPLVTSKNLKDGQITDKDIKYICQEDYDKINERSKVDVGDILFAMIGTIGNPVVVQVEPKFAIKNMALFKNVGKINPYFVKYYLESKTVIDKMQKDAKGSTQKFVALGYLRAFPINMPTQAEQAEIVRILDSLLTKEQQAKDAAEAELEKIDLLKKAILARAFRGELGTNDPAEPSAIELIKQRLSEKIVVTEPKKPRKIKTPEVDFMPKTIMQALASGEKLTPEKLKAETDLQIDDFYDQLKILIDNGQVVEIRVDGEAYLEAKNADRQPNN